MTQTRHKAVLLTQIHAVILGILCSLGPLYGVLGLGPQPLIYPLSLVSLGLFVWMMWSWRRVTRTILEPYFFFVMAAVAFNTGRALLEIFGLNTAGLLGHGVSPETSLQALYMAVVGLAALHLGALLSAARSWRAAPCRPAARAADPRRSRACRLVGYALLCVAFVPTLSVTRESMTIAASFGYQGLFGHDAPTGFGASSLVLSLFWMPAALFLLAGSRGNRVSAGVSLTATGLYVLSNLALGSRGPAIMALIACAWLYERTVSRIPRKLLLSVAVALLLLVPLIAVARSLEASERFSVAKLAEAFQGIDNPVVAAVSEAGGSLLTVAHTVYLVPSVREFDCGISYLYAMTTALPNLGWKVHPAIAHGLLADWLIRTVDPDTARRGGGLGYSFIAEAYANFGWFGMPIVLGAIGFLIVRLARWADGIPDVAKQAMVASFLSFFLWFARGESGTIIRPLMWYALGPYIAAILLSKRLRRRRASVPAQGVEADRQRFVRREVAGTEVYCP